MARSFQLAFATGLLLSWMASAAPAASGDEHFFPYPIKISTLKNGLTVVRVAFPSPGLAAFYSVVRVGSRNEVEKGHTGFAHFFEHVMFKGTQKHPEGSREATLGKLGFNENAFTSDDITVYHLLGPASGLEQVIALESDRFAHLTYSEQTFQTEAKAVLGEYHKAAANPGLRMEEELLRTAFSQHPYQHTTLGFYDDIKAMPSRYEYSQKFFKRWYTPDNTTVIVVGEFDDAKVMGLMEKHYGGWTGTVAKVDIPVEPSQKSQRKIHVDWPSPTLAKVVYGWHTPAARLDSTDAAVGMVLQKYLLGPTSKLYKELVLDKQLLADLGSWHADHRDPHLFTIVAEVRNHKDLPKVTNILDTSIKALVTAKVDEKKVEAIKSNIRYGLLMGLETPDDVAGALAGAVGLYGSADGLERSYQNIGKVQPKQLVEFAKRYFPAANRTILTLTSKAPNGGGAK
ncbi:MAG: M16 family metallopeptidase [Myxococcaceae bacterium]